MKDHLINTKCSKHSKFVNWFVPCEFNLVVLYLIYFTVMTATFGHSDNENGNSFIDQNQQRNRSARHIWLLQIEEILSLSNEFVTSLLL